MWKRKPTTPRRVQFNIFIPQPVNVFEAIGYVGMEMQNNPLITSEAFREFQDDVMSNGLVVLPYWGISII